MDEELSRLIAETVNTRAKLDVLAYFHRNPFAWESLEGLGQRLYRSLLDLEPAVSSLVRSGLLEARRGGRGGQETVYSYQRRNAHAASLERLLAGYEGPGSREIVMAVSAADSESRARALARKRNLDDLKTRFVSMVTHELRTPVTALRAIHTALLTPGAVPPDQQRQYLERAVSQCDRLTSLIENLLVLSGLHAGGELELYLSEVELPRLVEEVARQYRREAGGPEVIVTLADAPATVVADEYLVGQVLSELISNAVKFSPTAGKIWVRVTRDGDNVRFSVTDQGVGIAAREQERIFEEFYQAEEDSAQRTGGLGLGLFMSRRIVEAHGGKIVAQPAEGAGLTVCFVLPLAGPPERN